MVTRIFNAWAAGCSHVHSDLKHGRRSLAEALEQSEFGGAEGGPPFDWHVMLHLGDTCASQGLPTDDMAPAVIEQFAALKKHRREQIYDVAGNLDATGEGDTTQWWFRKWIDPEGQNTRFSGVDSARRPYPISGNWERYGFRSGNILFLMLSDRNDGERPAGRGKGGGWPAGAITQSTFEWWRRQVEENQDKIIVTCAHHVLRDTTTASGRNEGIAAGCHKKFDDAEGASYLYYVGDEADSNRFHDYFDEHPGAIDAWLGAHTHTNPDDTFGGKRLVERKWGITFANVSALTRYHGGRDHDAKPCIPMSRLLTFTEGEAELLIRCYLHTSHHAPQGWYAPAECRMPLRHPYRPAD